MKLVGFCCVCLALAATSRTFAADDELFQFLILQNRAAVQKLDSYSCDIASICDTPKRQLVWAIHVERDGQDFRVESTGDVSTNDRGRQRVTYRTIRNNVCSAFWRGDANLIVQEHDSANSLAPRERDMVEMYVSDSQLRLCSLWAPPLLEFFRDRGRPNPRFVVSEVRRDGRKVYQVQRLQPDDPDGKRLDREIIIDPDVGFLITEFRGFLDGQLLQEAKLQFIHEEGSELFRPAQMTETRWTVNAPAGSPPESTLRWTFKEFNRRAPNRDRFELTSLNYPEGDRVTLFRKDGKEEIGAYCDGKFVPTKVWKSLQEQRTVLGKPGDDLLQRYASPLPSSMPKRSWSLPIVLGTSFAVAASFVGYLVRRRRAARDATS